MARTPSILQDNVYILIKGNQGISQPEIMNYLFTKNPPIYTSKATARVATTMLLQRMKANGLIYNILSTDNKIGGIPKNLWYTTK